jgi:N-formylglutamate deformylase
LARGEDNADDCWVAALGSTAVPVREPFSRVLSPGPLVATAVHAGHDLRTEIAASIALDDATRLREEDPYTDLIIEEIGTQFVVHRSRFEVDLNRPRDRAVYLDPADAWGLHVWAHPLPDRAREASRAIHDEFYAELAGHFDRLAGNGPFLVLDVHSYNHRRGGPKHPPAPISDNPEVNVGTGFLDRSRWDSAVHRFIHLLGAEEVAGRPLDVRENVRFRGGHLSQWLSAHYATTACTLALEFKKVFMDEWTGVPDHEHLDELRSALGRVSRNVADFIAEEPR